MSTSLLLAVDHGPIGPVRIPYRLALGGPSVPTGPRIPGSARIFHKANFCCRRNMILLRTYISVINYSFHHDCAQLFILLCIFLFYRTRNMKILKCLCFTFGSIHSTIDSSWKGLEAFKLTDAIFKPTKVWFTFVT